MSRGRAEHQAKQAALQALGKDLSRRAGSSCELCGGKENPRPHLVPPPEEASLDTAALLCEPCRSMVEGGRLLDAADMRFLEQAIWSEAAPVQIAAIRLLRRVADELEADWATDALDGLWLPEEIEARLS